VGYGTARKKLWERPRPDWTRRELRMSRNVWTGRKKVAEEKGQRGGSTWKVEEAWKMEAQRWSRQ